MKRALIWQPRAVKEAAGLEPSVRARIAVALERLASENVRTARLTGTLDGLSKLRVGDYRVVFFIDGSGAIAIVGVGHRRDIYR